MRLGIDITPLQIPSPSGIGVATYETIRALARQSGIEIVLYGRSAPLVPFSETPLDLGLQTRLGSGLVSRAGNIAWLQRGVGPMLAADKIDVFWGTRHVLPRNAAGVALVATLYDFWYERYPHQQPVANRTLNRLVMRDLMRDGDVLTAISDATGDDARELFPASAEKVRTVYMGVDPTEFSPVDGAEVARVRGELAIDGPFVLALDVHNPRKNFSALLDAVGLVPDSVGPFEIVAVGTGRAAARDFDIAHRAEELGLSSRVRFVGDIAQSDLRALYTGAAVFVYPSIYEGFGMPVLEAMACGAPVVCANTSSLPEVAGDAAIGVDPTSAEEISDALARILGDDALAARLADLGKRRAGEFAWTRTADGMRTAFEDAITRHGA
jgi:glycosyltransferase involved in cell wall biosynthesis